MMLRLLSIIHLHLWRSQCPYRFAYCQIFALFLRSIWKHGKPSTVTPVANSCGSVWFCKVVRGQKQVVNGPWGQLGLTFLVIRSIYGVQEPKWHQIPFQIRICYGLRKIKTALFQSIPSYRGATGGILRLDWWVYTGDDWRDTRARAAGYTFKNDLTSLGMCSDSGFHVLPVR